MSLPGVHRVLLVEDDASIRRFVAVALDDRPVDVCQASSLAEARHLIRSAGPFRLLITDLMLPDGNGADLVHDLAANPDLRAGAYLAVFSAGLSSDRRQELLALGVDEVIGKPASLNQLLQCVDRAMVLSGPDPAPAPAIGLAESDRITAVNRYFGGDQSLYAAFRSACIEQFAQDRLAGDAAWQLGDFAALRRLSHSLKTVLQTLGHDTESAWARQLEDDAAECRAGAVAAGWARLGAALLRMSAS